MAKKKKHDEESDAETMADEPTPAPAAAVAAPEASTPAPAPAAPVEPVVFKALPKYKVLATKTFSYFGAIVTWSKGDVSELSAHQLARAKDSGVELEEVK